MKHHIGNVVVHRGTPPENNPYRGQSLYYAPRVNALWAFRSGEDTSAFTFWYAPSSGGAKQITDPAEIDWETSGVEGPYRR